MAAFTVEQIRAVEPLEELGDAAINARIGFAEAMLAGYCGIELGAVVTDEDETSTGVWRLWTGLNVGEIARILIVDKTGRAGTELLEVVGQDACTIDVASATPPNAARVLPVRVSSGRPRCGILKARPWPVQRVVEVRTKRSNTVEWDVDSDLLDPRHYALAKQRGMRYGIRIAAGRIPREVHRQWDIMNAVSVTPDDCVQMQYACGWTVPPYDLVKALVDGVINADSSGDLQSESLDGYSWSKANADAIAAMPHSALAILRRYQIR